MSPITDIVDKEKWLKNSSLIHGRRVNLILVMHFGRSPNDRSSKLFAPHGSLMQVNLQFVIMLIIILVVLMNDSSSMESVLFCLFLSW